MTSYSATASCAASFRDEGCRRLGRHLPAGVLSPQNGQKDTFTENIANRPGCRKSADVAASLFLPVLRGEMPGRAMRGSANVCKRPSPQRLC
ncbi:MAG: hypothetical protein EOR81_15440 [Mesorhizobium sp.]|nr:MAG: hypothetical protein EOR81_15440 [Mesorhizobium sp.]